MLLYPVVFAINNTKSNKLHKKVRPKRGGINHVYSIRQSIRKNRKKLDIAMGIGVL